MGYLLYKVCHFCCNFASIGCFQLSQFIVDPLDVLLTIFQYAMKFGIPFWYHRHINGKNILVVLKIGGCHIEFFLKKKSTPRRPSLDDTFDTLVLVPGTC